jgi:hypothetical protein
MNSWSRRCRGCCECVHAGCFWSRTGRRKPDYGRCTRKKHESEYLLGDCFATSYLLDLLIKQFICSRVSGRVSGAGGRGLQPLIICTFSFADATISLKRRAISNHYLLKSQRVSSSDNENPSIGIAESAGKQLQDSESWRAVLIEFFIPNMEGS